MLSTYDQYILDVTRNELAPRLTAAQLVKRIADTYNDPTHPFNVAQREIYAIQLDRVRADEHDPEVEECAFVEEAQLRFWGGAGGKHNGVTWSVAICTVEHDEPTTWIEVRNVNGKLSYYRHATLEVAAMSAAAFKKEYR